MRGDAGTVVYTCVMVLGPTACGKTALAVRLADALGGEILSADSRQVYRGLDIGSGKDLCEFDFVRSDGSVHHVPYHLIDIARLPAEYSVFDYQQDFYRSFADVAARGSLPVIAGGTGMYLDAVIRGYDLVQVPPNEELRTRLAGSSMEELVSYLAALKPELHNSTDLTERHRLLRAIEIEEFSRSSESQVLKAAMPPRPDIQPLILGISFPRDVLRRNITKRLRSRLKDGMIDEVQRIHDSGIEWTRLERLGLEYRFIAEYLQSKIPSEDELFRRLNIAIGQFAKRQETWFRGMERKGVQIRWLASRTIEERFAEALSHIQSCMS